MERTYRHVGYYFLVIVPLLLIAFYRTYLVQFPDFDVNFNKTLHVHAVIASLWIVMLIAQPFLIMNRKYAWHRAIGKLSYVVFPLLILSFIPRVIQIVQSGNNVRDITLPICDSLVMILLYSLAVYNRKDTPKHMRYMIATTIPLLGPTIGRIGPIFFGWGPVLTETFEYSIMLGILSALIWYDRKNRKDYKPYVVAVWAVIGYAVVFYPVFLR